MDSLFTEDMMAGMEVDKSAMDNKAAQKAAKKGTRKEKAKVSEQASQGKKPSPTIKLIGEAHAKLRAISFALEMTMQDCLVLIIDEGLKNHAKDFDAKIKKYRQ